MSQLPTISLAVPLVSPAVETPERTYDKAGVGAFVFNWHDFNGEAAIDAEFVAYRILDNGSKEMAVNAQPPLDPPPRSQKLKLASIFALAEQDPQVKQLLGGVIVMLQQFYALAQSDPEAAAAMGITLE